ncbi:MAG: glycine cleavage system protein H [Bacillota bacterium]
MSENQFLETTYDKFVFRASLDCLYHTGECWVREGGGSVTVGVTDYQQKTGGDIAFIETLETGGEIKQGEDAGTLETIKTTMSIIAPASGVIKEVNGRLEDDPQLINMDPFGEGWIYRIEPSNWEKEKQGLMDARTYFPLMEEKIRKEMEK